MISLSDYKTLPKVPGIYKLHDIETGKFYVGSSMNLRHRVSNHLYRFSKKSHSNPILQSIWNKDSNRIKCEISMVLVDASKQTLLQMEQIALDNSGVGTNILCMNILKIAGSHYGRKRPVSTIEKLRQINKGRIPSLESKEKMRQAKLGRRLSEEHKAKISIKGKKIKRPLGIKSTLRKLTDQQVVELRQLRRFGMSWSELAKNYQISSGVAKRIALRLTYKDVE